jgi:hypothetical protein
MTDEIVSTLAGIQRTLSAMATVMNALRTDAGALQEGLAAVRGEVQEGLAATKLALGALHGEMQEGFAAVRAESRQESAATRDDVRERLVRGFTELVAMIHDARTVAEQANDRVDHLIALVGPPLTSHSRRLERLEAALEALRRDK